MGGSTGPAIGETHEDVYRRGQTCFELEAPIVLITTSPSTSVVVRAHPSTQPAASPTRRCVHVTLPKGAVFRQNLFPSWIAPELAVRRIDAAHASHIHKTFPCRDSQQLKMSP